MDAHQVFRRRQQQDHAEDTGVPRHGVPGIDLDDAPVADDDDPSAIGQHVQVLVQIDVGQHFHDHVYPQAAGELHDLVRIAGNVVVHHVMGALFLHQRSALFRSGGADDRHARGPGHLYGRGPHAAARSVHQDGFARLSPGTLEQPSPRRRVRDVYPRALREGNVAGQWIHLVRRAQGLRRIGTGQGTGQIHPVSDGNMGCVVAHFGDRSGAVHARCEGQIGFHGIGARPDIGVYRVHAAGPYVDQDLSGTCLQIRAGFEIHYLGTAEFVNAYRFHLRLLDAEISRRVFR